MPAMEETETTGLRERKKRRTREAIAAAAIELFAERGFEATTIADIAAAADVAPRTFFAYFPSKESVVFHDVDALVAGLRERLREREPGQDAIGALRDWLIATIKELDFDDPLHEVRHRLIAENPSIAQYDSAKLREMGVVIAEAVAVDLGEEADALRPRLVAAAATALLATLDDANEHPEAVALDDPELIATLDEALGFLRAGIASFEPKG